MAAPDSTTQFVRYRGILGSPGYRVGEDGSVWSCVVGGRYTRVGTDWRKLKATPQKYGHLLIYLGRKKCRFVHQLVLEAFVGRCPRGMQCRHVDGDAGNNRLQNLMWGTRRDNYDDSVRHGTAFFAPGKFTGENSLVAKLDEPTVRKIVEIREATGFGAVKICDLIGCPRTMRGAVEGVIRGQSWNQVTGLPLYQPVSHQVGRPKRAVGAAEGTTDNRIGR